jgi:hypothetical protein
VPPDDPQSLATAVVAALESPQEGHVRARAALARFHERYTIESAADGMVRFYEAALSS